MKKYVSLILTAVMLFAVCIPAFAANINMGDAVQSATPDVFTKTTDENNQNPASYTVIIPADTEIQWGATSTEFQYSVSSQLEIGKSLKISVIGENSEDKLTSDITSATIPYKLSYSSGDGTVEDSLSYNSNTEMINNLKRTFYVRIVSGDWDSVPVTEYKDYLTFGIDIVNIVP